MKVRHRLDPGGLEEPANLTDAIGETNDAEISVGSTLDTTDITEVGAEHVGEFVEKGDRLEGGSVGAGKSGDGVRLHDARCDRQTIGMGDDRVASCSGPQLLEVGGVAQADGGCTHDGAGAGRGHPGPVPGATVRQTDDSLSGGIGDVAARSNAADHPRCERSGMGLVGFEERLGGLHHELGVAAVAADPGVATRRGKTEVADLTVAFTDLVRRPVLDRAPECVTDGSAEERPAGSVTGDGAGSGEGTDGDVAGGTDGHETASSELCVGLGVGGGLGIGGGGHGNSWGRADRLFLSK